MKRVISLFSFVLVVILFSSAAYAARNIRILYLNDFHGFAVPYTPPGGDRPLGGIAYLAGKADALRKESPSLLLAAGDMIAGSNWVNLFQGRPAIQVMNAMGFDAMALGNHEFDYGQAVLRQRIAEAQFPVLGANVEGFDDGLKPYVIREVDGLRVAIIGVVTDDVPVTTAPGNAAGLKFDSAAETVGRYVRKLRKDVDLVIVLSHIGYTEDRKLAEEVKGIDIIVGGHSHTRLEHPAVVGDTIIVQAWEHAKALGVLNVSVEGGKIVRWDGRLEDIRPVPGAEDRDVAAIVDKYERKVDAVLGEKIGVSEVDLNGQDVREKETNLGDFITDIMRKVSGADAAITNGGMIRTGIPKGAIRAKDVYSVLPFDNYMVAVRLTGRQILEALEHGVSSDEEGWGGFPQVSGISFSFSREEKPGHRVKEVRVDGKPLDPDREYTVVTNDFVAAGGNGYKAFGEAVRSSGDFSVTGGAMKGGKVVYSDSGRWIRDVVTEYIKKEGTISPRTDKRIVELP